MEDNYFAILWWFLPYIDMNQPWVHMCPPILNPTSTSVPPQLLGCPRALACFTYGNIHVSMLFSQIIPPLASPTESKVCSLYLGLFCCHAYRIVIQSLSRVRLFVTPWIKARQASLSITNSRIVITTFLNSIYMH